MLNYFHGYHRPTKINQCEYLTMNDFHMKISQFTILCNTTVCAMSHMIMAYPKYFLACVIIACSSLSNSLAQ